VSCTIAAALRHKGGEIAIEAKLLHQNSGSSTPAQSQSRAALVVAVIALGICLLVSPVSAFAGQSATGEAAFYPCTDCHPVTLDANGKPTKPLPNGMEKHEIVLEVHDILGDGDKACLACHDDPSRNPGKLILPDGSLVDITGDVSRVCQRCHFEKYRDWQAGVHGKNEPKCSAAGCHDPHTPSWIYVAALPPFQGTGVEVRAVWPREPFKPMASPPVPPPVYTPTALIVVAVIGFFYVLVIIGFLTLGRRKS